MPTPERPDAERIAAALLSELTSKPLDQAHIVAALDELLDRGVIHVAPPAAAAAVVSKPLTARELAALAAATLAEASIAARSPLTAASAHAHVSVADGYRNLAAVVASNVHLQPETEGNR